MVEVSFPLTMPSKFPSSNQGIQSYYLPPISDTRGIMPGETFSYHKSAKMEQDALNIWLQSSATMNHGLRTPPRELANMNVNPLLARNIGSTQYNSVPALRPTSPYSTSLDTVATAQYYSKAPPSNDSRPSTLRPESPFSQREHPARGQQKARTSENTSIAPYLQIPATINDSKGSLAEFAAQITCLFWFESSYTLSQVEQSRNTPTPLSPLVPESIPAVGFRKWVTTMLSTTQVSQNVILLALLFIYRLKRLNPSVKGKVGSEFRLLTVALMLGNKFLDDNTYTNKTWAEVSGINVREIHIMEVEFLSNMRYTLYASEAEWYAWHDKLGKFYHYFNAASKSPSERASSFLSLPPPVSSDRPDLPSPPVSLQRTPPFTTHPNLNTQTHPSQLLLPESVLTPNAHLSDVNLRNYGRKRSLEDPVNENPLKRVFLAPSECSSILTPSTPYSTKPTMPRLPMPNLTISTNNQYGGYHGSSSAHLPPPARSMSTVFPGPSKWPQTGTLPSMQQSVQVPVQHSAQTSAYPPGSEWAGSAATSPSSANFSQPQQVLTPHSLPSGYPVYRSSPYKPIRGVNTLLVPPSSASIDQPQQLGYDQMQYQPLGKPLSERRVGVLPYTYGGHISQSQIPPTLTQPDFSSI